jgi:hypothetical protein
VGLGDGLHDGQAKTVAVDVPNPLIGFSEVTARRATLEDVYLELP